MWSSAGRQKHLVEKSAFFMADTKRFQSAMYRVICEWPISCEHNLSDLSQNRLAWIGQAACAIEIKCPESAVREAWGRLTDNQRRDANESAKKTIKEWERKQQRKEKCQKDQLELMF